MTQQASAATGQMPIGARVHLAHAVVQKLADDRGIDLLHLKGPAVLPGLRAGNRQSSDVDVLVRPSHLHKLVDALESVGWEQRTDFATGSVFAHAANWWHDGWGWVDVHVSWPGVTIDAERAFDVLSRDAVLHPIAHRPCPVPCRTAQRLVLVLHAARSGGLGDVEAAWTSADPAEQAEVRRLTAELGAEVALAAGIGELELHRGAPTYALWHHFLHGGSRLDEWRARLTAATGTRAKAGLLTSALRVNRDHLRMELGHPPTRQEVRARQVRRLRRAVGELSRRWERR
ncbi:nucleotidyltransferase family protein [Nocardioides KLBMP 9356]|uniref:Nucleotidyltransferase family protein n=1 Tax=Nocardioides potassii TaxID=2911371 RepID=A0ABS9H836_9ACTN|nr:nucleotidyltransferase family protein [Nocardioides potassii]MCF6376266.1 nucleotidyltransferase family protein [Nocardioides potassii]